MHRHETVEILPLASSRASSKRLDFYAVLESACSYSCSTQLCGCLNSRSQRSLVMLIFQDRSRRNDQIAVRAGMVSIRLQMLAHLATVAQAHETDELILAA